MLIENKIKFTEFQLKFRDLDKSWRQDKISFEGNDKIFTAMYEPDYPMPSERDRIVLYNVNNGKYMLFLQHGSGCVVNSTAIEDIRKYLLDLKFKHLKGE